LSREFAHQQYLPKVPFPEQYAIAAFLDRETAKLDTLIAKKRRLIDLLGEQRAALISRAVTKGLNLDAPLKDSGVEWLGEIPAHWEVARLRFIADSIQTGPFGSQLHAEEYISGGTPVINPANIQNGRIVPDLDCAIDDPTLKRLSRYKLNEDDIVFARRGEMGRCALVTNIEDGWLCGTGSIRIRLRTELCYSPYLHLVLSGQGVKDWLSLESVGSTMENLNSSILSRTPVPNPSKLEQQAIATYIDCETAKIDALIGKTEETIGKLQEYRTALISAAVTGKIDVRQGVGSRE
jgi:type I restriction enzyme S subunit